MGFTYQPQRFGAKVVALRGMHGWTRRKLAKQAGLHEQHLAKIERGDRTRIEAKTVAHLAYALAVSSDYLLGLTDDPPRTHAAPAPGET